MTNENQAQNDEDFDFGCEYAMALLNCEPTEDRLNDLIDELDEDGHDLHRGSLWLTSHHLNEHERRRI